VLALRAGRDPVLAWIGLGLAVAAIPLFVVSFAVFPA